MANPSWTRYEGVARFTRSFDARGNAYRKAPVSASMANRSWKRMVWRGLHT